MRPSYHPEGLFDENKAPEKLKERSNPIAQLWHTNGKCPEDTIAVRRTKKEDVLRASSIKRYGRKNHRTTILKPRSADPDIVNESGHQVNSNKLLSIIFISLAFLFFWSVTGFCFDG